MSRPRVVPAIPRRSRHQSTYDIGPTPPTDAEFAADLMRVKARLAQRAAAKHSAPNVAITRQEVPQVPRVARWPRQHAITLESKESSLKGKSLSYSSVLECRSLYYSHSANSSYAIRQIPRSQERTAKE